MPSVIIPPRLAGWRLDLALADLLGLSRRGARRLLAAGELRLDGRPPRKGEAVQPGQRLTLPEAAPSGLSPAEAPAVRLLVREGDFAALDKPAGLPCQRLAGRDGTTLESLLPVLLEGDGWRLVNRLDTPTSGLVLAARADAAAAMFRDWENAGRVEKTYLAVVHGRPPEALRLDRAIDMARRVGVRVLEHADADPLRVTRVRPLRAWSARPALPGMPGDEGCWLVEAVILKGARHQIRAHLAAAGLPLLGDERYGPDRGLPLHLHHARLTMPGFMAESRPPWLGD